MGHTLNGLVCVRHVVVGLRGKDRLGHVPDENSTLSSGSHNELLVGGDGDLNK